MTDDTIAHCTALCDKKFSQIKGNGLRFSYIELSNTVASSVKFSNKASRLYFYWVNWQAGFIGKNL